jgi:hypothetical protein
VNGLEYSVSGISHSSEQPCNTQRFLLVRYLSSITHWEQEQGAGRKAPVVEAVSIGPLKTIDATNQTRVDVGARRIDVGVIGEDVRVSDTCLGCNASASVTSIHHCHRSAVEIGSRKTDNLNDFSNPFPLCCANCVPVRQRDCYRQR